MEHQHGGVAVKHHTFGNAWVEQSDKQVAAMGGK